MGGIGSGGWNRTGRATTADALRLDVNRLRRAGALEPGWMGGWQWSWRHGRRSTITIRVHETAIMLSYRVRTDGGEPEDVEDQVSVIWAPCRFGGARPFWLCPRCERRVVILYGLRRFRCRQCNRLMYPSQREREADRARRRADMIRARLGGEPGLGKIPAKPKNMHWRTYKGRLARIEAADAEVDEHLAGLLARLTRAEQRARPSSPAGRAGGFWR